VASAINHKERPKSICPMPPPLPFCLLFHLLLSLHQPLQTERPDACSWRKEKMPVILRRDGKARFYSISRYLILALGNDGIAPSSYKLLMPQVFSPRSRKAGQKSWTLRTHSRASSFFFSLFCSQQELEASGKWWSSAVPLLLKQTDLSLTRSDCWACTTYCPGRTLDLRELPGCLQMLVSRGLKPVLVGNRPITGVYLVPPSCVLTS
jgi:hypothetical protein